MKVMVLVKANENSEAAKMPDKAMHAKMGKYNAELFKAGLILAAEGLHPSSKGHRVLYTKGKPKVLDGPFTETKELVAGFWIWQVKSMKEALEWVRRAPFLPGDEVELRPVFMPEDFDGEFGARLRKRDKLLRAQSRKKK